jgi:hypothetical protein
MEVVKDVICVHCEKKKKEFFLALGLFKNFFFS